MTIAAFLALGSAGLLILVLSGLPASAHGGGLDRYGCHNDRKAGTYHCHRGPCAGKSFSSQAEMLKDPCSKS